MPEIILCKTVRDLPGQSYSPAGSVTLQRILDMLARRYPDHQPKIYELSKILYVECPEAR